MIGDEVSNRDEILSPEFIRHKLNLTKRQCNSRIGILMSYGLVEMINNRYMLTTLGKDACDALKMIDIAIKMHRTLDTTNILEFWKMKGPTN
jgi:predicted transcriptional regulator